MSFASAPKLMRKLPPLFGPWLADPVPGVSELKDLKDLTNIPIAYTGMVHRQFEMKGSMYGGMRVRVLEPFAFLTTLAPAVSGTNPALYMFGSNDGASIGIATPYAVGLCPYRMPFYSAVTSSTWNSGFAIPNATFLTQMAVNYGRFRNCGRQKFHYRPLVNTFDTASFIMAVSSDPAHPVIGIPASLVVAFPTGPVLDNGPSSLAFTSYEPWSAEFDVDTTPKYTYLCPKYGEGSAAVYYPEADTRTTCHGSLGLQYLTPGASYGTKGILYWENEYEFWDAYPLATNPAPFTLREEELPERKLPPAEDDLEVLVPPKFCATPSSVPGGSLYQPAASASWFGAPAPAPAKRAGADPLPPPKKT